MTLQDNVRYIFKWNALTDACPKCRRLNQREWWDQDLFQNLLWDPYEGDIWDLDANMTLAHPNCRCQLAVRVEAKPMITVSETFMRYGKQVTVHRDPTTGRFTT